MIIKCHLDLILLGICVSKSIWFVFILLDEFIFQPVKAGIENNHFSMIRFAADQAADALLHLNISVVKITIHVFRRMQNFLPGQCS